MSTPNPDFTIGTIVALVSHPFSDTLDKEHILLGGDYISLSPLMVVVETLKENKALFDENTGEQILKPGSYQCKCIWYSSKSSKFEETWLTSRLLKIIEPSNTEETNSIPFGTSVVFKTAQIEIGKKKASLKQIGALATDKNKSITGLLAFTSPLMQVIGSAKSESKEPFLDPKTGKVKREISKRLIKCKYYNSTSEKFSEVLIPIEALTSITKIGDERLSKVREWILNKVFLTTSSTNPLLSKTIIKPLKINFRIGNYYLEGMDYLENKVIDILIEATESQFIPIDAEFDQLPMFEATGKHLIIKPIRKDTLAALPPNKPWRIKYKDANNNVTTRTIYNSDFYHSEERNSDTEETETVHYLKASCLGSDGASRYFRIDRIQTLKVLEIDVAEAIKEK